MIAVGSEYEAIAALTVPRAERVLQHPITLFTEPVSDPWQFKLELFDQVASDHVLMIDSDIVLHGWDWEPFLPDAFNAVLSQNVSKFPVIHQALRDRIPEPAPLFNTGLWLAPRAILPVFQQAQALLKGELENFPFNFVEETPTNLALHRTGFPVNALSTRYNSLHHIWQTYMPEPGDTYGMHLLSGTPSDKLKRVHQYCERYPL